MYFFLNFSMGVCQKKRHKSNAHLLSLSWKKAETKNKTCGLFFGRESLLVRKSALFSLLSLLSRSLSSLPSGFGKKNTSNSLSKKKSIIFSTRASFFCVRQQREKKMFSSAQARSTMIGSSSAVRSTRSSKVRSTTVRVRAMKGACNLFSSFFSSAFFLKMCGFLARARAQGRDVQRDCRSERCIDDRKRERWWWRFPIYFLDLDLYRSLFLPLMVMKEKKKRFWERDGASFLP